MPPESRRAAPPPALLLLIPLILGAGSAPAPGRDPADLLGELLTRHLSGGLVDYRGLSADPDLPSLAAALAAAGPESPTSREAGLAFWINAYNALVLKGVADRYPIRSVADVGPPGRWTFFREVEFTVGGRALTLDRIEHEILRGRFAEPRVHFALVCASLGCPRLRPDPFRAGRLEAQLEGAARAFVNDPEKVRFDREAGVLRLSRIFEWYAEDFRAGGRTPAAWVARYLEGPAPAESARIEYLDYSWELNDLHPGRSAWPPPGSGDRLPGMKLPPALVDHISAQIVSGLVRDGAIRAADTDAAGNAVAQAFAGDLMVEDRLNEEVREILRTHSDEMTRRGVQYHDMFKMIKAELVRKRKLIL